MAKPDDLGKDDEPIVESVFLDTQVFVTANFDLTSANFQALVAHLTSGRLKLLMTDITENEIRTRIKKNVHEEMEAFRIAGNKAKAIKVSKVETIEKALEVLDPKQVIKVLSASFDDFLKLAAETLSASELKADEVFEKYFSMAPPFADNNRKRAEFPDAFVVQALCEWMNDQGKELLVVTADQLFADSFKDCGKVHHKADLAALLDHVSDDDEALAGFLRKQLTLESDQVAKEAEKDFLNLGFYVKDEDGEAEISELSLELDEEPKVVAVDHKEKEAILQMTFKASYTAHLTYVDSSTGWWDAEDQRSYFMESKEQTVERKTKIVMEVHVIFEGLDQTEFDINFAKMIKPTGDSYFISPPMWD